MGDFTMPSLGSDMETGRLVAWEKRPGDAVHRGDVIAVVETQKGAIEIEGYEDGTLGEPLVALGEPVPVGTVLARIAGERESAAVARAPPATPKARTIAAPAVPVVPAVPDVPASPRAAASPGRTRASPVARRRARELGIDLAGVTGRGPGGAIELRDVLAAASAADGPEAAPEAGPKGPPRASVAEGMRAAIAAAMTRSKREIPHYYLAHDVPLGAAVRFVDETNAAREPAAQVLLGALFLKAVASAARAHPTLNGHTVDGQFRPSEAVHVGMAVRLRGGGLVAPAILDADTLSIDATMVALRDLVARVREGRMRASELALPTLTVSSLGERGVDRLYGVIHPPQVAIVGFGTPARRATVDGDAIVAAPIVSATLAADHRASDGHAGARFLADIARRLQSPETL